MRESIEREIRELHVFFEAWLGGGGAETAEAFPRVESAFAADFRRIAPDGAVADRESQLAALRHAFGVRPGLRIEIRNPAVRVVTPPLALATYEEWQWADGEPERGRLSTVVFRREPGLPNDLAWVHVHETWLAADPVADAAADPPGQ